MSRSTKPTSQLTPRCPKCQKTWDHRTAYSVRRGYGLNRLTVSGEIRLRRRDRRYRELAEVTCDDCGHTWWSSQPDVVRRAKYIERGL